MTTTSFRARSLACALLATTAFCGLSSQPAAAQDIPNQPSVPESYSFDRNGVDLASGKYYFMSPDLSIGNGGSGLDFVRSHREAGFDYNHYSAANSYGSSITITIGTVSDEFDGVGQSSRNGTGATLTTGTTGYLYTSADGVKYQFDDAYWGSFYLPAGNGRISTVTYPDGRVLTYHYETVEFKHFTGTKWLPVPTPQSRLISVTSNEGYQLKLEYDYMVYYDPEQEEYPSTQLIKYWMDVNRVTAINNAVDYCDPDVESACPGLGANWPTISYTKSGSTVSTTDALNRTTSVTYNTAGRITGIKRASSATDNVTITYDATGKVATFNGGNGTYSYAYLDSNGVRTVTITDPASNQQVVTVNLALGRVTSRKDALNRTTSFTYDALGRLSRTTLPEGNYVENGYDARSNLTTTTIVAKTPGTPSNIVTTRTYPLTCSNVVICNKPTSVIDARGNTTDFTYDGTHGGLLTATLPPPTSNAVRPQTRYSYSALSAYYKNSAGSMVAAPSAVTKLTGVSACRTASACTGTADEVKAAIAYGSAGVANNLLPTSVSTGNGTGTLTATIAQTYDGVGNILTVDGPLSGSADTVRMRYDAARQQVGAVSADPDGAGALKHRASRTTYNPDGQPTKTERGTVNSQSDSDWAAFVPLEEVQTSYDASGRPVVQKLVAGGTTHALSQMSYDALGRPECIAQRMNPAAFTSLPASACTLGMQGTGTNDFGPDRIAKTSYDAAGQVTKTTSAYGITGQQADDATVTYTSNGKTQTVTDAENNKTSYVYDGHDRPSQTLYPSATKGAGTSNGSDYEQVGYDANSNVTSLRNRAGETAAFTFDALNRPTLKDLPGSEPDVSYSYDLLGRVTGASQTGNSLSFTYDALGRNLTQAGPQGTNTSAYDIAGRRTRLTHADGFYVDEDHLITGEVSAIRENGATSGVGVLASFAYDDLGRRTSITRGNGTATSYSFDAVSRLSQITDNPAGTTHDRTLGFSYNPASQIVGTTRSNDLFAWAGHGSGTTGSTANGLNQLAAVGGTGTSHDARGNMTADGLGKTFGYSSENLLTSASGGVTLSYDPALRLYQVAGATTTRFAYDGADVIAEYNASNALQRRFVHGPGTDEPLVWYEGAGTTDRRFLHADERGSIVTVSNGSGSVTNVNRYDEYGKPAPTNVGRFQYTGQKWIGEIGLYDYKARMYHPTLGRFLQSDPIGYGAGMNMYAYVGGDPVNLVDPTGLKDAVPGSGGCNPGNLDENIAYVCGQRPPPDTMRSLMLLDSLFARPAELLPYDGPPLPGAPAECGNEACDEAVVTGLKSNTPFIIIGGRYRLDPNYRKPSWAWAVDWGTGILFAGPIVVIAGVESAGAAAVLTRFARDGREISAGKNWRFAPFGNRVGENWFNRAPHYHRRSPDTPGQGIGRHRPWEKKSPDTSFWDRF
jgi:RHS repeat-associated protein